MSETSSPPKVKEETWHSFRDALEKLLAEATPPPAADAGLQDSDIKRIVTEAVSAILLESNMLEKVLLRTIQKIPAAEREKLGEALRPTEAILKTCEEAFRSMTLHTLVPALQKQIKEKLSQQLVDMGKSEEFKDLIDSRFRMMEQYLRSDVIPKVVEKTIGQRQT